MKIQVILEPSDEGGFTAIVPSLPGCISEGNTKEEALKILEKPLNCILNLLTNLQGCYKKGISQTRL